MAHTASEDAAATIAPEVIARSRKKLSALAILLAVVLNAALGHILYQNLVIATEAANLQAATEREAAAQAAAIERYLQRRQSTIEQFLQRPAVQQALPHSEQIEALQAQLQAELPEVLSLRLFALNQAKQDRKHQYPIRFAELDLINRAQRGDKPAAEASLVANKWLVYSAHPLLQGDVVSATALIVASAEPLQQLLQKADGNRGEAALVQKFSTTKLDRLAASGSALSSVSASVQIGDSKWQLQFQAGQALLDETAVSPIATVAITLTSLLICIALGLYLAALIARKQLHRKAQQAVIERTTERGKKARAKRKAAGIANPIFQNQDILDVDVASEDEDILGLNEAAAAPAAAPAPAPPSVDAAAVPEAVFRSYDIRGIADSQITPEFAELLGKALGSEAQDQGESSIIVGRDGRNSSPALAEALIRGICASGCDVIDIGVCPSPLVYFGCCHLGSTSSGVMVTASHNPAEYNGFKMVVNGVTLADEAIMDIRARILRGQFHQGNGAISEQDLLPEYIDRILSDVALAGDVHIVVDAGNGATGEMAPLLFEELGCEITRINCEIDGNFPNHAPDPSRPENLQQLIDKVKEVGADLGVAFDGDGDRIVVVTPSGRIIWPDELLMLFARDIVSTNPGADVIFDVKSTRLLNQVVSSYGGRPIMWKTGHAHMKAKMLETGALLGGEFSGHIFIKHRWYGFDDGVYAAARLLEIMTLRDQPLDELFEAFPKQVASDEILVPIDDDKKVVVVEKLIKQGQFNGGEQTTIDGLRVDFDKGWGLVRASNTSAALTLRFEAESEAELDEIQQLFKQQLSKIDASLALNF